MGFAEKQKMSGGHAVKTLSMKQLSLAAAIAAASSLSSAGPLAPIIEPLAEGLAGTPLDAIIAPLNEIDSQLSALDGGGDNPLQPILDQLQGGGSGGDNPLQPILDQLQGDRRTEGRKHKNIEEHNKR